MIPEHYTVALIDQVKEKVDFFDSGGIHEQWVINRIKRLFNKIKPMYKFNVKQYELLQEDDYDGYCQTWVWIWLYYILIKEYSHTQFKRLFHQMGERERTEAVRVAHYYLINR